MPSQTATTLGQTPRLDIDPQRETTATLASHIDEILKYLEMQRRRLGRIIPYYRVGTATVFNPANLADGAGETTTVVAAGARLGDVAQVTFSLDLQGVQMFAWVSADDVVSVRFQNETGGAVNLGSGTIGVWTIVPPGVS